MIDLRGGKKTIVNSYKITQTIENCSIELLFEKKD